MKKLFAILLAAVMVFAMCACGDKSAEEESQVANPITECTYDEMLEKTGIDIKAPDNAEDIQYSYIESEDSEIIAQVSFELNDEEFCYRAQPTAATSIMTSVGEDGLYMADDLAAALNEGVNIGAQLSGLNYKWKASASIDIQHCEGVAAFNEDEVGFVSWLDVVPGVLYSLSMDDDANQDVLMNTAEQIFVPLQGDAE